MAPSERPGLVVGDERIVEAGPVAHGGHVVAHSDGRTLFVRHALPGESVRVVVTEVNRRIVRADAVEVLRSSPDRVRPPCPHAHAGGCGGCDFQHADLPAQRRMKSAVLAESLQRFGGLPADLGGLDPSVEELPGHPDGLRWRTRVRWATGPDGTRGLRRHRSHAVVAIDDCRIAVPAVCRPDAAPEPRVVHDVRGRTWRVSSDDFWQVHPALPEALVATVLDLGGPRVGQSWWDLYSGAGLFSAFVGEAVGPHGRVDAVESAESGVRAARRALHDLPQVHLHVDEVDRWLAARPASPVPDGVVLDPPRAGAGAEVVRLLSAVGVPVIVYVACDPVALGRDVGLFAAGGYRMDRLRAFDAFPMTHHLETVARLVRQAS